MLYTLERKMLRPLCVLVCAMLISIELCGVQVMADTQADIQKEDGQCGESLTLGAHAQRGLQ